MGTIAQANASTIRFKQETTWGTAPAGTYSTMRITSATIRQTTGFTQSAELRTNREPGDTIRNNVSAEGTIGFEASINSFDSFFESLFGNTYTAEAEYSGALDVTTVSSPTAHIIGGGSVTFTNIEIGDWVNASNFSNAANNGIFYVSDKTAGEADITIYNTAAVAETTATTAGVRNQRLTVGSTLTSLSIEQKVPTVEALYEMASGMVVTGINMEITPGNIITGQMTLVGKNVSQTTTSVITQSSSVITTQILNAIDNVIQIREEAMSPAETWKVSRLAVNLSSPANPRFAISDAAGTTPGAIGVQLVPFNATASMRIFVEHGAAESNGVKELYDAYLAGDTRTGLAVVFHDLSNADAFYYWVWAFQSYKITRCEIPIGGNDQDLFLDLDITAQVNNDTANGVSDAPTAFCMFKMTDD